MSRSSPVYSCVCATRPATHVDRLCCSSSGPPASLPRLRLPRSGLHGSAHRPQRCRCRIPRPACSVRLLHVDGSALLPLWRRLKQSWACIPLKISPKPLTPPSTPLKNKQKKQMMRRRQGCCSLPTSLLGHCRPSQHELTSQPLENSISGTNPLSPVAVQCRDYST